LAFSPKAVEVNTSDWWGAITSTDTYHATLAKLPEAIAQSSWMPALAIAMLLGGTMTGSLFSADAWNNVTFTAGEVKDPRRNLPLSLALGTGLVIVLYLLANVSYLAALPIQGQPNAATAFERGIAHAQEDRVATAVMETVSPVWGPRFMAAAIMISTFGCVNGLVLMGARLYYAMAQDGLFFHVIGRLNRRGVPAAGLVLQAAWATVLAFTGTYSQLLDYIIFATLLFYVLTVAGLFVLRRTRPHWDRPYRAFGYPIVPALYVALCAAIALDLLVVKPLFTWPGLIIVLTGIPVYLA
jgi:APA family basic amino acid/polyamine antiporter